MSDPLRTDAARPADGLPDIDKEARIEQLLLAGLDQYFAGRYDQAINIWTRVVFLERGHNRARAYIERARSALAERHRESEELLHRGIAAFNEGQTDSARELITRAVEQGGPHDVALVLLDRLNRLAAPTTIIDAPRTVQAEGGAPTYRDVPARPRHSWRIRAAAVMAVLMSAIALAVVSGLTVAFWTPDSEKTPVTRTAMPPDPLPIARSSDLIVARARALQSSGHLHDALRALDAVDLADPLRTDADKLRGELQRQLLDAAPPGTAR